MICAGYIDAREYEIGYVDDEGHSQPKYQTQNPLKQQKEVLSLIDIWKTTGH
jgi:hypothetical protein